MLGKLYMTSLLAALLQPLQPLQPFRLPCSAPPSTAARTGTATAGPFVMHCKCNCNWNALRLLLRERCANTVCLSVGPLSLFLCSLSLCSFTFVLYPLSLFIFFHFLSSFVIFLSSFVRFLLCICPPSIFMSSICFGIVWNIVDPPTPQFIY